MKRELNVKFLAWLLGALILGGAGVHAVHEFQNRRHAGAWLRQAEAAGRRGETGRRLNYLARYLDYRPADAEVLAEYSLLLDEVASTPPAREQANALLQRALTQNPDRRDVRLRIVHRATQRGSFAEAGDHLRILLQASPSDSEYAQLLGQCLEATGEFEQAADWYEKAIQFHPTGLGNHVRLANLLQHRLEDPRKARQILDRMVAANEHSFQAFLYRARFCKETGQVPQAVDDTKRACRLAPTEPDVLLFAAALAPAAGPRGEIRDQLRVGLAAHPRHVGLYRALAELEVQANHPREAVACLRRGLTVVPDQPALLQCLCDLLIRQGDLDEAGRLIGRLRQLDCPAAKAGYWDAQVLIRQRHWREAARLLEQAAPDLAGSPEWTAPVHTALGYCYDKLGDRKRQLVAYQRAAAGDAASRVAQQGLADALLALGEFNEAMAEYRQLIQRADTPKEYRIALVERLAQFLFERRRFAEADLVIHLLPAQGSLPKHLARLATEVALANGNPVRAVELGRQVASAAPADIRAQLWLGHILEAAGQSAEAEKTLREAITRAETIPDPWVALVQCLARAGRREEAEAVTWEMRERLPPEQVPLALACCYQALAQPEQAEEQLQAALGERPDDCTVLQKVADYYLSTSRPGRAEQYLRRLIAVSVSAPEDQVAWARRRLALLLAEQGDGQKVREALALLDQNWAAWGDGAADQRVRARVLATQPGQHAEALRLLKESAAAGPFAPEDEFLLARLFRSAGEPVKAREHLLNLLASHGQNPLYLGEYVRNLLDTGEVREARRWLTKLERLAPETKATQEVRAELQKTPQAPAHE